MLIPETLETSQLLGPYPTSSLIMPVTVTKSEKALMNILQLLSIFLTTKEKEMEKKTETYHTEYLEII